MIDKEQARAIVEKKINEPDSAGTETLRLVILDNQTIEKEWGWVCFLRY
jgi:hypothetical protein